LQAVEGLRERYFGPSFELLSHDKVNFLIATLFGLPCELLSMGATFKSYQSEMRKHGSIKYTIGW
jgi:hypothetical protein